MLPNKFKTIYWYATVVFTVVVCCFYSCKKDTTLPASDIGYNYFPCKLKSEIVYDVDSTVYDDFLDDTLIYKFQIKEVVDSLLKDNEGRDMYRIVRYKRNYNPFIPYSQIPWTLKDVWNWTKTSTQAIVTEENIPFVKLVFPVKKLKNWNGNVYNTYDELKYKYKETDISGSISTFNFDSTLTVVQEDYTTQIERRYKIEKYAKGIGMIYREYLDVHSVPQQGIPVVNRIEGGVHCKFTLNNYK